MSLNYAKDFIYDNFPKLVQHCDLQTILQAETCTIAQEILTKIQFTEDNYHNNRRILFEILRIECATTLETIVDILRTALTRLQDISTNSRALTMFECMNDSEIIVKHSTRFYDTDEYNKTKYYRTRSKRRGHVLIINNIDFDQGPKRRGADIDEINLTELFRQLHFEIVAYTNLKCNEMIQKAQQFANDSTLQEVDICFVILMSHGGVVDNKTVIIGTNNSAVREDWFIKLFNNENCPYLVNIPKVFIFHVCRRPPVEGPKDSSVNLEIEECSDRIYGDMIICHPTVEGSLAGRYPSTGSWYIQLICKIFKDHAHELDIQSLLQKVDEQLEHFYAEGHRQTSTFQNIAFKTCYLHPGIYEENGRLCKYND